MAFPLTNFTSYLETKQIAPSTVRTYVAFVRSGLGKIGAAENPSAVEDPLAWARWLNGLAQSSRSVAMTALRHFSSYCVGIPGAPTVLYPEMPKAHRNVERSSGQATMVAFAKMRADAMEVGVALETCRWRDVRYSGTSVQYRRGQGWVGTDSDQPVACYEAIRAFIRRTWSVAGDKEVREDWPVDPALYRECWAWGPDVNVAEVMGLEAGETSVAGGAVTVPAAMPTPAAFAAKRAEALAARVAAVAAARGEAVAASAASAAAPVVAETSWPPAHSLGPE